MTGDLNRVIRDTVALFEDQGRAGALQFIPDPTVPLFIFDPDQIRRIINNLADNALAAIQQTPAGQIVIRTSYDNVLKIVRIEMEDNGPGIPRHLRERIFEPYVTTKPQGTGLGLALVKRMVEDHHGFIRAFSDGKSYTRFVIELPAVEVNAQTKVVRRRETRGENQV